MRHQQLFSLLPALYNIKTGSKKFDLSRYLRAVTLPWEIDPSKNQDWLWIKIHTNESITLYVS